MYVHIHCLNLSSQHDLIIQLLPSSEFQLLPSSIRFHSSNGTALCLQASCEVMNASSPNRNEDRDDSFRVPPRQKRKHDKKPDKIISQLFQDPHPSPLSPNLMSSPGLPNGKTPVEGKMTDAVLDRLSILLMSGCSIQLACNEVHFFLANLCFHPFFPCILF